MRNAISMCFFLITPLSVFFLLQNTGTFGFVKNIIYLNLKFYDYYHQIEILQFQKRNRVRNTLTTIGTFYLPLVS